MTALLVGELMWTAYLLVACARVRADGAIPQRVAWDVRAAARPVGRHRVGRRGYSASFPFVCPANQFPPEDYVNGFKNQYQSQSLSPIQAEAYSIAAERVAALM